MVARDNYGIRPNKSLGPVNFLLRMVFCQLVSESSQPRGVSGFDLFVVL